MRRKYTAEMVLENMARAREKIPGLTFSADMIVGFPGEREEDFLETAAFCKKAEFLHVHIFPYSIRKGTEAAGMPDQIAPTERKRRSAYLANVQKEVQAGILDRYIAEHRTRAGLYGTDFVCLSYGKRRLHVKRRNLKGMVILLC